MTNDKYTMPYHLKVRIITALQHLTAVAGIVYWWPNIAVGVLLSIVCWFMIFGLGVSAGYHRLTAHRAFTCSQTWQHILLSLGAMAGFGSSIAWTAAHRLHHQHSDVSKELDPYWPHGTWWQRTVSWWTTPRPVTGAGSAVKDLVRSREHQWWHRNYFRLTTVWVVVLSVVSPWLLVFAWALPGILSYYSIQAVGHCGHNGKIQPHNNNDHSSDPLWLGIITLGEGWQNTHHHRPQQLQMHRWDITGWFIARFVAQNKS